MGKAFIDFEGSEFNIYKGEDAEECIDYDGVDVDSYAKIVWSKNQLEIFEKLEELNHNVWVQIYDVYLNDKDVVTEIGFRITPEGSFSHEYPSLLFEDNGNLNKQHAQSIFIGMQKVARKLEKATRDFYKLALEADKSKN